MSGDRTSSLTLRSIDNSIMAKAEGNPVFALGEVIVFRVSKAGTSCAIWLGKEPVLNLPKLFLNLGDSVDVNVSAVMEVFR